MSKIRLIPYRGDLVSARFEYKQAKKRSLRKFKRHLLKHWNLSSDVVLWQNGHGYINNDIRKLLGIEENFLSSTRGLESFGIRLKPTADVDKVINLAEEQKEYLRDKCIAIFNKYGKTVKVAYYDGNSYDYKIFKDKNETSFDGQEDEQLAILLYRRLIMYMVDNDSTDTSDKWSEHNPNDFDYWTTFEKTRVDEFGNTISEDARSQLKYFTYTFNNKDILKIVNDRLFTKRTYKTLDRNSHVKTIDKELFNELLDNGDVDNIIVDTRFWNWNSSAKTYSLNYEAVKTLRQDEFLIFIQTHLDTFYHQKKKKWYQRGVFGFIATVVVVAIAVTSQQYWLVGVSLGSTLVIAGVGLSISGALIGNKFMVNAGQIIALAGEVVSIAETIAVEQATIEQTRRELLRAGLNENELAIVLNNKENELLLEQMLDVGKLLKQGFDIFSKNDISITSTQTPEQKIREVFIAEDQAWDCINRIFPEYVIPATIRTF